MDLHGDTWVHLYEFDIGGEPGSADRALLSAAEHSRAGAIRDPARKNRFVARRAALHRILSRYPAGVGSSSSDSRNLAAVAVAPRAVGVDVEVDMPRAALEGIARRMFSPEERGILDAAGPEARRHVFHRCWVAKEAYAKGLGRGLGMRFDTFSVAPALRSPSGIGVVGPDWSVSIRSRGGMHLAVAAVGHDWEVVPVG